MTFMLITADGKKRRSHDEWAEIVTRFRTSDLSARQFALREGVGVASLQRWISRVAEANVPAKSFVDVTPCSDRSASWTCELELPGGAVLRLRS
jgi:DNA-binding transcriptional regulator YiaG